MKTPASVKGLETLGRIRLSDSFFLRDFLFSEISAIHGIPNIPDNPDLAIAAGRRLCAELLEPPNADPRRHQYPQRIPLRRAERIRQPAQTQQCLERQGLRRTHLGPPRRRWLHGGDRLYRHPAVRRPVCRRGRLAGTGLVDPRPPALSHLQFFPKLRAFNIQWHERPRKCIDSFIAPRGCLTKPDMVNHAGGHSNWYGNVISMRIPHNS